jgi:hypothetical protein
MSNKNRNQDALAQKHETAAPPAEVQPAEAAEAAPSQAAPKDVSAKYFIVFWGIIILSAAAAWILAIYLPNVSESIIERWIMAALAAALAVFLFIYK